MASLRSFCRPSSTAKSCYHSTRKPPATRAAPGTASIFMSRGCETEPISMRVWYGHLRRRSDRTSMPEFCSPIHPLAGQSFPVIRIAHPWPHERFLAVSTLARRRVRLRAHSDLCGERRAIGSHTATNGTVDAGPGPVIAEPGWREFLYRLKCKGEGAGIPFVEVPPACTSQECSRCSSGKWNSTHRARFAEARFLQVSRAPQLAMASLLASEAVRHNQAGGQPIHSASAARTAYGIAIERRTGHTVLRRAGWRAGPPGVLCTVRC